MEPWAVGRPKSDISIVMDDDDTEIFARGVPSPVEFQNPPPDSSFLATSELISDLMSFFQMGTLGLDHLIISGFSSLPVRVSGVLAGDEKVTVIVCSSSIMPKAVKPY